MIFGVRDVCDITLKDITTKKPNVFLNELKMSSIDIAAAAVYAMGGRGNPRRIVWEGSKETKYSCEDCKITTNALALLTGSTLTTGVQYVPVTEVLTATVSSTPTISLTETIYAGDLTNYPLFVFTTSDGSTPDTEQTLGSPVSSNQYSRTNQAISLNSSFVAGDRFIVTYYKTAGASNKRIIVTSDHFPALFELSGYTLWRSEADGKDYVARIKVPKAKLLSTFNITMKPDGDPSTFKFEFEVLPASSTDTSMVYFDVDETASI